MKRLLLFGAVFAVLAVAFGVLPVLVLTMPPGAAVSCLEAGRVVHVPQELAATTRDGTGVELNHTQLTHAATIITIGAGIDGVGREGVLVALMAGLTESRDRKSVV